MFGFCAPLKAIAQTNPPQTANATPIIASADGLPDLIDGKRSFTPAYFAKDSPQTASDMVGRLPGFSIDNGDAVRGFGGAAGNVLIDGARPTSKSEGLQAILSRIPATSVERIELLEGAAAGALAPGKTLVVNVVRKADAAAGGTWEFSANIMSTGRVLPDLEASYATKFGAFNVTMGFEATYNNATNLTGFEGFQTPNGVFTEQGPNDDRRRNRSGQVTLGLDGALGAYKISANGIWYQGAFRRRWDHIATRTGASIPFRIDVGQESNNETNWEIGADVERDLLGWTSKLAFLVKTGVQTGASLAGFNTIGTPASFGRFASESLTSERVTRATFKRKFGAHQIEWGGEYAFNSLDFDGVYAEGIEGNFVVQQGDISSTEVSEDRREAFISDSWTLRPQFTLETTLTGEWSTINQSGDAAKERSFFYLKPRMKAVWKPSDTWTYRAQIDREVGQLDFGDFADSASVGDGNSNSGNPELRPEQTWLYVGEVERRWGKRGVFTASLRYAQIEDKLTLVPTGNRRVGIGNIPEASQWGYNVAWTIPLDFILVGLETEGNYRWRDSELIDPLTDSVRPFSGNNGNQFNANLRYELPAKKLRMGAWIWRGDHNRDYRNDQRFEWSTVQTWGAWIETTAIKGLTVEVGVEDPFGNVFSRVREDFTPDRRSNSLSRIQYRERTVDPEWYISAKGRF